jgi:hypothetical protein
LSFPEVFDRYEDHPEMKQIDSMGVKGAQRNNLRIATRNRLYLEDLFNDLSKGAKLSDEAKSKPFVMAAVKLLENQGDLIDSGSLRQMEKDEVFRLHAPSKEVMDGFLSGGWIPPSGKVSAPAGGWKLIKQKSIQKENAMNTHKEDTEVLEDNEENFTKGVMALMTPEFVSNYFVTKWHDLNAEFAQAAAEIKKRNLPNDFAKGKTREELVASLGQEFVDLIDRVVEHTQTRNNLNKRAEAIMNKEPGASWF